MNVSGGENSGVSGGLIGIVVGSDPVSVEPRHAVPPLGLGVPLKRVAGVRWSRAVVWSLTEIKKECNARLEL